MKQTTEEERDLAEKQVWDKVNRYKELLDKGTLMPYKEIRENIINPFSISLFIAAAEKGIFQFYSKEFIQQLAKDIKKLKPNRVIEVGAGDGNLSRALKQFGVDSKPTDNYEWEYTTDKNFKSITYPADVEKLPFKEALEKYNPDLVIICWEELGAVYTQEILKYPSVKWVVWIGEGPGGCCGHDTTFEQFKHEWLKNPYCLARTDLGGHLHTGVYLFKKE